MPDFPEFKPLEIMDRDVLHRAIWEYQPEISDISFTNLLIWRAHYDVVWSRYKSWYLFMYQRAACGLMPLGPAPRLEPALVLLNHLRKNFGDGASLERADKRFVSELQGDDGFIIEPVRDHADYIYRGEDLSNLAGRKYDAKRNHINIFRKNNQYIYREITEKDLIGCLETANRWCQVHGCDQNMELHDEYLAIINACNYFPQLGLKGGLIEIDGRIEAFTMGEMLNEKTAVIHIEKADNDVRGLYTMINQQFVANAWVDVPFINREQDLGDESLRKAKESYLPDHLVEKYRVKLA